MRAERNWPHGANPRASGRAAPPPEVMIISDLAEYLQVSTSSLYKLVQSGRVPGQRVGKHWRFHKGVIDRWLSADASEVNPPRSRGGAPRGQRP